MHWLEETFAVSARRACRLVQLARASYWYTPVVRDERALIIRLRDLAFARSRFGYRRLTVLLQREGWKVGKRRVQRLYRAEGLMVRSKHRRKRAAHLRVPLGTATAANRRWSMDFVTERLENGRYFRVLTLIDQYTRECLQLWADVSLTGQKVVFCLQRLALNRGLPLAITVDNGAEFCSRAMDAWAYQTGVKLDFIRPGRPAEMASSRASTVGSGTNASTSISSSASWTLGINLNPGVTTTLPSDRMARWAICLRQNTPSAPCGRSPQLLSPAQN